jgi:hypothetical protein
MRQRSGVSAATWPCLLTPPLPSPRTRPPHLARASQTLCVLAVLAVAAAYSPGTVTFRAKPVSRGGSSSMVSPNVDQLVVLSKVWPTLLGAGTVVFWGGITTQRINSLQEGSVQVDKKIDDLKANNRSPRPRSRSFRQTEDRTEVRRRQPFRLGPRAPGPLHHKAHVGIPLASPRQS